MKDDQRFDSTLCFPSELPLAQLAKKPPVYKALL